ncbi:HAD phosphoserine phosphatase-like hydrolase, family IB [Sphingobacterium spiritivorum ATCC 33300]|uniref:phosphoserine phosphatase n=2 Tax=Sphingobacterium spiritivorum TaxID=258 RepID=D7VHR5_SPHSI|nr:HAD-IB family phosphatase [Sphingobacterium spiritivorum]EEI91325.1 HAD phosphoserine phosphatase-like hydrolase, family IB [Sphingobacterium spiritivorum ATCC 33300]EFK59617.1 HAD phosphoserine phosphatase-like hydrolase, family IB [Sphingobacterium spiritivorum ATCC 33861]QQS97428.1 HAD-IB family phosphatase [Sphingobacterium spiritivorum]QQT37724.1 HAD-IB family phosphatase [Sphingobacterium spiritivorum]WQD34528.1 HAD-IB family phosphatase [Sphingobacterium spiritivorum]
MKNYYIIDFDSTFTQVEALDELARISLEGHPDQEKIYQQIEGYTNLAMEGKISFRESLAGRIKLLKANKSHLDKLVSHLKKKVSRSFSRNREFFNQNSDTAWIVSGGFKEFIIPVVTPYHIKKENIYANTFKFDQEGNIIGYDENNPLSDEGGKVKLLQELKIDGRIFGIGDGYSDFQLKESGLIEKFFAFTENIARQSVTEKADHVTPSFDEFLYVNDLPRAISYPKNRILCLIVGDVPEIAAHILKRDGFSIRIKDSFEEKYTKDVGMLLLGPDVDVSDEQLSRADKLKTIGFLGDIRGHISKNICNEKGIVVFDDKKGKKRNSEFIPRRMADFINNGDTDQSRNFPNLILPKLSKAHRLLHIHKNVPGVMAQINNIYAENNINIVAQFLMTRGEIGYAVTDLNVEYEKDLIKQLKKIDNTIKFRILY